MRTIYNISEKYASIIRIRKEFIFLILNCLYWVVVGIFAGFIFWLIRLRPDGLLISYIVSLSSVITLVFGYIGGMIHISRQND